MTDSVNAFWNRCQAVMLIETSFQIKSGAIHQNKAIVNLIGKLSVIANRLHISHAQIDDSVIRLKLKRIAYYHSGQKAMVSNNDLAIAKTMKLYRNSQSDYLLLLHKAHILANPNAKLGELFFAFMSARESDAESKKIHNLLLELDRYCRSQGLLQRELRTTTLPSDLKCAIRILERDSRFRKRNKNVLVSVGVALNENMEFFKEYFLNHTTNDNGESPILSPHAESLHTLSYERLNNRSRKHQAKQPSPIITPTSLPTKDALKRAEMKGIKPFDCASKNNNTTNSVGVQSLSPELLKIISDKDMLLLRQALIREKILTLDQFEKANPWDFMNSHALYTIGQRQNIFMRIAMRLKDVDTKKGAENEEYHLVIGSATFCGKTPADAFIGYCEQMAQKFPLRFRSLMNSICTETGTVALSRVSWKVEEIQMLNPVAYVRRDITTQQVEAYVRWMQTTLGEPPVNVVFEEPMKLAVNQESTSEPPKIDITSAKVPANHVSSSQESTGTGATTHAEILPEVLQEQLAEAESMVLNADLDGMRMEQLADSLGITTIMAKRTVAASRHLLTLCERVYHCEAFVDWEEGADALEQILERLLTRNDGYVSASQLYEFTCVNMQMFLNENGINDSKKVYDFAQHLFEKIGYHGKHFIFRSKAHISRRENEVSSILDIMRNYAEAQGGFFKEEDFVGYLRNVGVKTGNLRGQMKVYSHPIFLFYAPGQFLYAPSCGMDDGWFSMVENALEELFEDMGDHMVLRDIQPWWYTRLPALPAGHPWTAILLQSVLYHFSGKLGGAHTIKALTTQTGDTLHAMLVSGSSEIQTFPDAVAACLIDDKIQKRHFEAEELRQYLVKRGMISGGELLNNMPRVLGGDARFAWDAGGKTVVVNI